MGKQELTGEGWGGWEGLGLPEVSSTLLQRPCYLELLQTLPLAAKPAPGLQPPAIAPYLAPRPWHLWNLHRLGPQSAQNWPHPPLPQSGLCASPSQDPSLPDSTQSVTGWPWAHQEVERSPRRAASSSV